MCRLLEEGREYMGYLDKPECFLGLYAIDRGYQDFIHLLNAAHALRQALDERGTLLDDYFSSLLRLAARFRFTQLPDERQLALMVDLLHSYKASVGAHCKASKNDDPHRLFPPFCNVEEALSHSKQILKLGGELKAMPEFQEQVRLGREIEAALDDQEPLSAFELAFAAFYTWHGPADLFIYGVCDHQFVSLTNVDPSTGRPYFQVFTGH